MRPRAPHPWHLIAMKLAAARSSTRRAGASDWPHIFDLLRTCRIDLADLKFREMVLQFGGEESLRRMEEGVG